MASRFLLAILLVPLLFATSASSRPCDAVGQALGIVQITSGTATSTYYVDDRGAVDGNGIWLYQETNGAWSCHAPGVYFGDAQHRDLQRGTGPMITLFEVSSGDICIDNYAGPRDVNIL